MTKQRPQRPQSASPRTAALSQPLHGLGKAAAPFWQPLHGRSKAAASPSANSLACSSRFMSSARPRTSKKGRGGVPLVRRYGDAVESQ